MKNGGIVWIILSILLTGFFYSCASTTFVTPLGNITYEPSLSPVIGVDTQGQELGIGFGNGLVMTNDRLYRSTDQNLKNVDVIADKFLPEDPDPADLASDDTIEHAAHLQNRYEDNPLWIENAEDLQELPNEPLPEPAGSLVKQKELTLLAMCVYGESRSEPYDGKISIAYVVMNRVKEQGWYGKTVKEVLLKPYQFSCFLKSDPNFKKLFRPEPTVWKQCFKAAWNAYSSLSDDPTLGANHYCRRDTAPPWRQIMELKKEIGNHAFFRSSPQAMIEWWYTHYVDRQIPRAFLLNDSLHREFFKFKYLMDEYQILHPKKDMKI